MKKTNVPRLLDGRNPFINDRSTNPTAGWSSQKLSEQASSTVQKPATATTANALVRFADTAGQATKNSPLVCTDGGALSGVSTIVASGAVQAAGFEVPTQYSLPAAAGNSGQHLVSQGVGQPVAWANTVMGPGSSVVDNTILRFDGTSGENFQGSGVSIDDTDNLTVPGEIRVNTIAERSAGFGVSVDGLAIKDGRITSTSGTNWMNTLQVGSLDGLSLADISSSSNFVSTANVQAATIITDTISEKTPGAGCTIDGIQLEDEGGGVKRITFNAYTNIVGNTDEDLILSATNTVALQPTTSAIVNINAVPKLLITSAATTSYNAIAVDTINERTSAAGCTVDGCLIKDGAAALANAVPSGTITNDMVNASAGIVDTKLATISTAGKVSNSATTATSANTASAIIARDASGNFTAGTITMAHINLTNAWPHIAIPLTSFSYFSRLTDVSLDMWRGMTALNGQTPYSTAHNYGSVSFYLPVAGTYRITVNMYKGSDKGIQSWTINGTTTNVDPYNASAADVNYSWDQVFSSAGVFTAALDVNSKNASSSAYYCDMSSDSLYISRIS